MSHEEPLKKIFALICGDDPLTQIFVDLLPEQFSQRIFVSETSYAFINPRCFLCSQKLKIILSGALIKKSRIRLQLKYTRPTYRLLSTISTERRTTLSSNSRCRSFLRTTRPFLSSYQSFLTKLIKICPQEMLVDKFQSNPKWLPSLPSRPLNSQKRHLTGIRKLLNRQRKLSLLTKKPQFVTPRMVFFDPHQPSN